MLTMLLWLLQAVLGGVIAAAVFQLVKSNKGWQRVLGWGVGVAFSWFCLKGAYYDVRLLLWGQFSQLVPLFIHGYLLATTIACLAKGSKQARGAVDFKPGLLRRLPKSP